MKAGFVLIGSVLISVTSAQAADLPSRKGPVVELPPAPATWTGPYLGLNAGGSWGENRGVSVGAVSLFENPLWFPGAAFAGAATGVVRGGDSGGFVGGGQIGYNLQLHPSFVVGVEADIQGFATSGGAGQTAGAVLNGFTGSTQSTITQLGRRLEFLGTVRGRVGYLVTPALLAYGTGGLAYGGVNLSLSQGSFDSAGFFGPGFGSSTFSDTLVGWTAGGGLEWEFAPKWTVKGEYLYYDLGSATTTAVVAGPDFTFNAAPGSFGWVHAASVATRFDGHLVRAGVNYRFD